MFITYFAERASARFEADHTTVAWRMQQVAVSGVRPYWQHGPARTASGAIPLGPAIIGIKAIGS